MKKNYFLLLCILFFSISFISPLIAQEDTDTSDLSEIDESGIDPELDEPDESTPDVIVEDLVAITDEVRFYDPLIGLSALQMPPQKKMSNVGGSVSAAQAQKPPPIITLGNKPLPPPPPITADTPLVDMANVTLPSAHELEKALQTYLLLAEVVKEIKLSNNDNRHMLKKAMNDYRDAYTQYMLLLEQHNLYTPSAPPNPAGLYAKKHNQDTGETMQWAKVNLKPIKIRTRNTVRKKLPPTDRKARIQQSLPSISYSKSKQ